MSAYICKSNAMVSKEWKGVTRGEVADMLRLRENVYRTASSAGEEKQS